MKDMLYSDVIKHSGMTLKEHQASLGHRIQGMATIMLQKFKVLMYGWEYPPLINGGLGIACYGIVNGLMQHGNEVNLLLPYAELNKKAKLSKSDMISLTRKRKIPIDPYQFIEIITQSSDNQSFLRDNFIYNNELIENVIEYAYLSGARAEHIPHDIIHAHDWLSALAGIRAKQISKKPLVLHIHSLETDRSDACINAQIYSIEKFALEEADKIIAVSQFTKRFIHQYYAIPSEKIVVVHNGIFENQLNSHNNDLRKNWILFLGRLTHQKGPYYFLQAAEKLLEIQEAEFIISGVGDQWHEMIKFVAKKRLSKHVHFTGFLTHKKVVDVFSQCKIYVMPSVSEPFGLAALEALSNQVPVIISKQSGAREVLPHLLSVDYWDVEGIANKMYALLNFKPLREMQIKEAWKQLPQHTWSQVGLEITEIYKSLVAG